MRLRTSLVLISILALPGAAQEKPKPATDQERREAFERYMRDRSRWVRLGPIPNIKLQSTKTVSEQDEKKIRTLIASLARLKSPDIGLSATLSGDSFAPLGKGEFHSGLITDHELGPDEALKELVSLGPRALPYLLKSLGDETPTALKIEHNVRFGGMWHDSELPGNPLNKREHDILAKNDRPDFAHQRNVESYRVRIGDVCFVAVGQIVGRSYAAVRYQPTACIILNSPVETPNLRSLVRQIWDSPEPAQTLFDSLLLDYATLGNFNGQSLDGWSLGSHMQCSAAMRLLYYFPEETAPLLADRLKTLEVSLGEGLETFMNREVRNGVRTKDFIQSLSWSTEPRVRKELDQVMKRAADVELYGAALPRRKEK